MLASCQMNPGSKLRVPLALGTPARPLAPHPSTENPPKHLSQCAAGYHRLAARLEIAPPKPPPPPAVIVLLVQPSLCESCFPSTRPSARSTSWNPLLIS